MPRFLPLLSLTLLCAAAGGRPAAAAELKILEPADRSLVRGAVVFRIRPVDTAFEQFFSNPEVVVQDETGKELNRFPAVKDARTGICTGVFETRGLRDGLYLVTIHYRTLLRGRTPQVTREDLTLGVRNTGRKPGSFTVDVPSGDARAGELLNFTVRVLDSQGQPMPGARAAFRVDRGALNDPAEISDSEGELTGGIESETAQIVTLTVAVEGLPPVTRVFRFVE